MTLAPGPLATDPTVVHLLDLFHRFWPVLACWAFLWLLWSVREAWVGWQHRSCDAASRCHVYPGLGDPRGLCQLDTYHAVPDGH
jgi:hypothetical protein